MFVVEMYRLLGCAVDGQYLNMVNSMAQEWRISIAGPMDPTHTKS